MVSSSEDKRSSTMSCTSSSSAVSLPSVLDPEPGVIKSLGGLMIAREYRAGRAEFARRIGPAPVNWVRTGERDPSLTRGRGVRSSELVVLTRVAGIGKGERTGDVCLVTSLGVREGVPDNSVDGENGFRAGSEGEESTSSR